MCTRRRNLSRDGRPEPIEHGHHGDSTNPDEITIPNVEDTPKEEAPKEFERAAPEEFDPKAVKPGDMVDGQYIK